MVYLQLGRIAEAQKEFNAALAIETRYSIGPWLVGNIHTDAEQYQSQIDRFEEIIVQNQEYARARNNLALAHLKTGNLELARREAEEAIQINSRFAEAHNTLALIQERQGRADLAIKSYQKALDLDPDNPVLLYNAALAYDSMDSGPKAMELLKRAHRIYQDAQEGPKEKHLREVLADWKRKYQPQSQNPAEIQMAEEIRGQEEKKNIAGSQSSSIRPQVEPLKKPGTGELEKEAESSNQPSGPKILKVTQPSSSPSERRDPEE
ncbi:MAG: tetratricopeptide repeat protein, partial [Nitrospinaceae bacterium]|nr:tetratricopeptide repeat protein [Nitrospinaceae bacterium]NIR54975.1 tetratricopeptide repeat protein [Nitrospinaceae bacterium]NIS85389.1 tetratricopeptide repeat protein [Nitrospinaceae bacterium]NIT82215.1 tetratricopeptide repeat protein [Nitrospinaceae bacterium]NIU44459.1 tetratricopeptide repeat protein [Nitrospinaceae bacterium]